MKKYEQVSTPVIKRLPRYHRYLGELLKNNITIPSTVKVRLNDGNELFVDHIFREENVDTSKEGKYERIYSVNDKKENFHFQSALYPNSGLHFHPKAIKYNA